MDIKNIPTVNEAEVLREMYKEAYGDTSYQYQKNMLDWLEFRLLNYAYEEVQLLCKHNVYYSPYGRTQC